MNLFEFVEFIRTKTSLLEEPFVVMLNLDLFFFSLLITFCISLVF